VIECGYDAAELLLRHLYPESFVPEPVDAHSAGSLHAFDQSGFFRASQRAGLSGVGYIYIPDDCRSGVVGCMSPSMAVVRTRMRRG
jgi:hypothetical protein